MYRGLLASLALPMMKWLSRISLVLCVAVAGMWLASFFWTPVVRWRQGAQRTFFVAVHRGQVELAEQSFTPGFVAKQAILVTDEYGVLKLETSPHFGEGWEYDPHSALYRSPFWFGHGHQTLITIRALGPSQAVFLGGFDLFTIPIWFVMVVFAIAPTIVWTRAHRRRVRIRDGICVKCGYDLRATPDRCPECGTVPETAEIVIVLDQAKLE